MIIGLLSHRISSHSLSTLLMLMRRHIRWHRCRRIGEHWWRLTRELRSCLSVGTLLMACLSIGSLLSSGWVRAHSQTWHVRGTRRGCLVHWHSVIEVRYFCLVICCVLPSFVILTLNLLKILDCRLRCVTWPRSSWCWIDETVSKVIFILDVQFK